MSESGVYYTADQLTAMTAAIQNAQNALSAGQVGAVTTALSQYYQVQIYSATGVLMRGYAQLAQATATNTGVGVVPNNEVENAVGGKATYTPLYQATLALNLAQADLAGINANGGQVPTLAEVVSSWRIWA